MKALARAMRRLKRLGWKPEDLWLRDWVSPHTFITYAFDEACRIEDIPVPRERPGDSFLNWLRA